MKNSRGYSTQSVLVILIFFALLEIAQSCHRRVEYHHHYPKRRPHHNKGYGHEHHGGGYGHHGGGGYGHGGHQKGGHGKGHGHGGGYHGGGSHGKGYEGGHGHGGGYGHGSMGHGYGHEGHGYGDGGGHHDGYKGGGHGGYGHDGYGHGRHGGGGEYGNGGHGGGAHGHEGYGGNHGHEGGGHGHGGKGHKYKYQMYESMRYDDKDGYQQPSYGHDQHGHGYSHNTPHYMQKGYGHSGPYPNTEYSTPVETSVIVPPESSSYDSTDTVGYSPTLDAADTADLIRNSFDSKENDVMSQSLGNFADISKGHVVLDSSGSNNEFTSRDVVSTPTLRLTSPDTDGSFQLNDNQDPDPSKGNFDMDLTFNSPDLPDPFRRNSFDAVSERKENILGERRRRKLSSRYNNEKMRGIVRPSDSDPLQKESEQSNAPKGGSDYLENDADYTGTGTSPDKPTQEFAPFLNF